MGTDNRTFGEKVSDAVAKFGGSWFFILSGFVFIFLWVLVNAFLPYQTRWDDYPFILLNLFLSLVAAFQAPFILMAQRRVELKQDLIYRSLFQEIKELVELDLSLEKEIMEANKKMEKEMRQMKRLLRRLLRKVK